MTDRSTRGEPPLALRGRAAEGADADADTIRGAVDTVQESGGTPLWFEYLVVIGGCGVLFCGGLGLLLAVLGHFSPSLALLLGAVGTVVGTVLGRPRRGSPPTPSFWSCTPPAIAMCLVAGGVAIWNSIYIGQHVVVDSDPGVYEVAGRWLADHPGLTVPAGEPWSHTGLDLTFGSAGMYPHAGDTVQFQFAHLFPVLLAESYRVGGAGLLLRTPAVLGAIGLLAIYMVGTKLIRRPWVVVAAVTALGISLPELAFTRETYSEPSTQVLVWVGLWFIIRGYEDRRFRTAFLAGLAVGGTLMTHIDAVIYLVPIAPLIMLSWLAASSSVERRSLFRVYTGGLLGIVPPALLGTFDVQRRAGHYYDDLHSEVLSLYHGLALSIIASFVVAVNWPMVVRLLPVLVSGRRRIGVAASWTVAVSLALAWGLRPGLHKVTGPLDPTVGALQKLENVPIEPTRTYAEQSVLWIQWYAGPIALALAIAGLCLLTFRIIAHGHARGAVLLALTLPVTALYLWAPPMSPDQITVMRRYVPTTLPLFLLAAGVALDALVGLCAARTASSPWPRRTLAAGAAGMIAFPLTATLPLREFQPHANDLALINRTCRMIGPRAAVLFPPNDADGVFLSQTVRSWCRDPAAQFQAPISSSQLREAGATLRSEGRTLWVLAAAPTADTAFGPGLDPHLIGQAASPHEIRPTISKPASTYWSTTLIIYAAEVPAA